MTRNAYFNRLYDLRGNESQKSFAESLGMTQQNYAYYESGKQKLNQEQIKLICKLKGCTPAWLIGLDIEERYLTDNPFTETPIYGHIAAGTPIEMMITDRSYPIPTIVAERYPDAFLLQVDGESMNRILPNGCYALIDPCKTVEHPGKPYAVCVNGHDATIKRVKPLNNGFMLIPDSTDPTYRPEVFDYNEEGTKTVTIIGRVVFYVLPNDWEF